MSTRKCPCGKGIMNLSVVEKKAACMGVDVDVKSEAYICPCCGIEIGTVKQASSSQKAIADAYRKKTGLLTGEEINTLRKEKGLSIKQLADLLDVCTGSIEKWEGCIVQDFHKDRLLRKILM